MTSRMTKIELKYFDLPGAADKIRLALAINGVEFEDVRVKQDEWPKLKPEAKFGQMPLMRIDDGPEMAQSGALLRLAATMGKAKLMPKDSMDQFKVNEAMGLVDDIHLSWRGPIFIGFSPAKYGYPEDFATTEEGKAKLKEMRETWVAEELPKYMALATKLIEANGSEGWLASKDEPTIADLHFVTSVRMLQIGMVDYIPTTCLDEFKVITAYIERFLAIPEVAKWYSK